MANYRKSFNLRNGVQIDDDNFIVNANGLVGIGTSIPTDTLDVKGNAKILGIVTTTNLYSGFATVGLLSATTLNVSGEISASTFYGSAAGLTGIYAVAVDGWHITNSGISTVVNVGVGTTNPQSAFQIGNSAVTIDLNGNAAFAGILTSPTFVGNLTGNVTGNVNSSGLSTFSAINVGSAVTISSGIVTALNGFVGNLTGNVTGNLTGNVFGNATGLSGIPNIVVGVVTAAAINSGYSTAGVSTVTSTLHVGSGGTAFSALNIGKVGIGTALPTSELQIRKNSGTLLEVVSENGESRISVGQSVGVGNSSGLLRFGNAPSTFELLNTSPGSFNSYLHSGDPGIGTGSFNWIYGQDNSKLMTMTYEGRLGIGKTNPDNTLHVVGTSTVTGNAFFGNSVSINNILTVPSIIVGSSINLPAYVSNTNLYNTTGISTFVDLDITGDTNISGSLGIQTAIPKTFLGLDASAVEASFFKVGVGTTSSASLRVSGSTILSSVSIGGTDTDDASGVNIYGKTTSLYRNTVLGITSTVAIFNSTCTVGVGSTLPKSAVDFTQAGKDRLGGIGAYMIVPVLNNSERSGLIPYEGGVIFNTTTKEFQGYNNTEWVNLGITTSSVLLGAGNASTAPLKFTKGSSLVSSGYSGAVEYDGTTFYTSPNDSYGRSTIPLTVYTSGTGTSGINALTSYPLFPSGNDTIRLPVGTYLVKMRVRVSVTGSTISSNLNINLRGGGTAVGSFSWGGTGAILDAGAASSFIVAATALGTNIAVTATSIANPRQYIAIGEGILRITSPGTIIPSYEFGLTLTSGTTALSADNYMTIGQLDTQSATTFGPVGCGWS